MFLLFGRPGLPDKYQFDSIKINAISKGIVSFEDKAFQIVGDGYQALGLAGNSQAAGFLGLLTYGVLIFVSVRFLDFKNYTTRLIVLMGATSLLGAVFLSDFSKEQFLIPFLTISLFLQQKFNMPILTAIPIFIYGSIFRTYWIAIGALYLFFCFADYLLRRRGTLSTKKIVYVGLLLIALSPVFASIVGVDLVSIREQLNVNRIGESFATTAIFNPLPGTGFPIDSVNFLAIAFEVVIPIPLLLSGDFFYTMVGLGISTIWVTFFRNLKVQNKSTNLARTAYAIIAMLAVNSLFEPDFGSVLRHLSPLFPFLLASSKFEQDTDLQAVKRVHESSYTIAGQIRGTLTGRRK